MFAGTLVDLTGGYTAVYLFMGCCMVASGLVLLLDSLVPSCAAPDDPEVPDDPEAAGNPSAPKKSSKPDRDLTDAPKGSKDPNPA